MRRFWVTTLLALIIASCGWALWNKDKFNSAESAFDLVQSQLSELVGEIEFGSEMEEQPAPSQFAGWSQPSNSTIRIATFNIQAFGPKKSSNTVVMERLSDICKNFDLIAIQEIRSSDQSLLPKFVDKMNAGGGHYSFAISPRLGRTSYKEQAAYIFDESKIQLDNSFSYTINDPDDVMHREPFVGWFRTRGPRLENTFTFTLANVHMDSKRPDRELAYLTELRRIIRKDGRGEDDVILIGDFNAGDTGLEPARKRGGLAWAVSNTATNTRNTNQYDNIVFDPLATDEFTNRAGVFDFMKRLNLSLADALAISDHMPVWAEFSIYEGGVPPRIAEERTAPHRVH